jgi:bacterial leucyl aminopeptidase
MRLRLLMTLCLGMLSFCVSAQAGEKVWISLGDKALSLLQKHVPTQVTQTARAAATDSLSTSASSVENVHLVQVDEDMLGLLSQSVHTELHRCGGYMYHASKAEAQAAMARLSRSAVPGVAAANAALVATTRPSYVIDQQAIVQPMLAQMQASNIAQTILDLSNNYNNRYYQTSGGLDSSNWLKTRWTSIAAGRADISVNQFSHAGWKQPSVILTITGTDNAAEVVVLGAHLDSINQAGTTETTRAPGADDDASGVASLTEVIRSMVASNYKPRRTIKFMAYAAEEVGLRGSQEIAKSFAAAATNVVGVMQLDMTNYKGSANDIYIYTDYTDSQQNTFITNLIKTYLPTLTIATDKCGYACSDHASWNAQGYAASLPFEASFTQDNKNIHTANDTFANSGNTADHSLKFARTALAYAVELGSDGVGVATTTQTFTGSLTKNQTKSFGPFKANVGTFTASTTGSGDIDVYAKRTTVPSTASYDCRSIGSTSTESCSINLTASGDAYVLLNGYAAGNYTLTVKYSP